MERRTVLKAVASALIGAGLLSSRWNPVRGEGATRSLRSGIFGIPMIETTDRTLLFYKDWGHGKAVVFIHSWALNSDMWQYQMNQMTNQGLRCIAYDRRGHGRSSQPGQGYDYDTLADDLAIVMDQLDLRDATLVSHSMGAGDIVRYLSRHGAHRVARIVLLAPTTPFLLKTADNPTGVDQSLFEKQRILLRKDCPRWFASGASAFFGAGSGSIAVSPEMIQWGVNLCLVTSLKALIDCYIAMSETDFRAEMKKITLPTLIIHGDADLSAPLELTGRRSAELITNGRLKIYKGAPHGLFLTHMDDLNNDLLTFIKS